jgi:hypothetical protein
MAEFKINVPVVQADPSVTVDITAANPLGVGKHTFRLTVVDDSGNESDPAFVDVVIVDTEKPTAVLDLVNRDGKIVDPSVGFAQPFILSGARSKDDPPGKVKEFRFTLLDRP